MSHKEYYVYILTNHSRTVLYTGMTNDIERRVFEHKQKLNPKSFSSKYQVSLLMWFETHNDANEAIKREKLIKRWKRTWKVELIKKENPEWIDLSRDWFD
ncbi:GIY-YIG nuclease family protein [Ekhidna sp. To15]|uniref:GIY-YIG nuclease family protein n=1 Tax=Ekhidna sp. To15 TaxID=3395267 RepID=UPI003F51CB5E